MTRAYTSLATSYLVSLLVAAFSQCGDVASAAPLPGAEISYATIPCSTSEPPSFSGILPLGNEFQLLPESKRSPAQLRLIRCESSGKASQGIEINFPTELIPSNFDGFEAIAAAKQSLFLAIESRTIGKTSGYLARADQIDSPERYQIKRVVEVPLRSSVSNRSIEAISIFNDRIYVIEELNFPPFNAQPVAHVYDLNLKPLAELSMPQIPFRVTDASVPDANGKFWVMNTWWPGDFALRVDDDPFDKGKDLSKHLPPSPVERLLQLQITSTSIELTSAAPIRLPLEERARNWEALMSASGGAFIIATDTHPQTIVARLSPSAHTGSANTEGAKSFSSEAHQH